MVRGLTIIISGNSWTPIKIIKTLHLSTLLTRSMNSHCAKPTSHSFDLFISMMLRILSFWILWISYHHQNQYVLISQHHFPVSISLFLPITRTGLQPPTIMISRVGIQQISLLIVEFYDCEKFLKIDTIYEQVRLTPIHKLRV